MEKLTKEERNKKLSDDIKYFQEMSKEDAYLLIEGLRETLPWAEFQRQKRILEIIRDEQY